MQITVEYAAQLKRAAGVASESVDLDEPSTFSQLLERVADKHGDPLRGLLFDENDRVHPSLLLFLGDEQIRGDASIELSDGDVVSLLTPISGG